MDRLCMSAHGDQGMEVIGIYEGPLDLIVGPARTGFPLACCFFSLS